MSAERTENTEHADRPGQARRGEDTCPQLVSHGATIFFFSLLFYSIPQHSIQQQQPLCAAILRWCNLSFIPVTQINFTCWHLLAARADNNDDNAVLWHCAVTLLLPTDSIDFLLPRLAGQSTVPGERLSWQQQQQQQQQAKKLPSLSHVSLIPLSFVLPPCFVLLLWVMNTFSNLIFWWFSSGSAWC